MVSNKRYIKCFIYGAPLAVVCDMAEEITISVNRSFLRRKIFIAGY
jgi:hypothetical protein